VTSWYQVKRLHGETLYGDMVRRYCGL